jgi:hypothetical protein
MDSKRNEKQNLNHMDGNNKKCLTEALQYYIYNQISELLKQASM